MEDQVDKKKSKFGSLSIDNETNKKLSTMMEKIVSEETSVTKSSLNTWIINWFYHNKFNSLLTQMKKDFFNPRKSFRKLYKTLNDEDLEKLIRLTLKDKKINKTIIDRGTK